MAVKTKKKRQLVIDPKSLYSLDSMNQTFGRKAVRDGRRDGSLVERKSGGQVWFYGQDVVAWWVGKSSEKPQQ